MESFEIMIFFGPVVFAVLSILGILLFVRPFVLASACVAILFAAIAGIAYWLVDKVRGSGEGVPLYLGFWICYPSLLVAGVALAVFVILSLFMLFGVVI